MSVNEVIPRVPVNTHGCTRAVMIGYTTVDATTDRDYNRDHGIILVKPPEVYRQAYVYCTPQ